MLNPMALKQYLDSKVGAARETAPITAPPPMAGWRRRRPPIAPTPPAATDRTDATDRADAADRAVPGYSIVTYAARCARLPKPANPSPPSPPPFPPPDTHPPNQPSSPFAPPAPPAAPSTYSFWRCYMQRGNKKFVRLYSEQYKLMANAIEGRCEMNTDYGFYQCGALGGCNPYCQDDGTQQPGYFPPDATAGESRLYSSYANSRVAGHYV